MSYLRANERSKKEKRQGKKKYEISSMEALGLNEGKTPISKNGGITPIKGGKYSKPIIWIIYFKESDSEQYFSNTVFFSCFSIFHSLYKDSK